MSDSQTNSDVEDVLSSIRRLVSDTASPERVAPADTPEPEPKKVPDAFILTSAQRVNTTAEKETANEPEAALSNLRDAVGGDTAHEEGVDWARVGASDEYYEDEDLAEETPVVDFIRHRSQAVVLDAEAETSGQPDDPIDDASVEQPESRSDTDETDWPAHEDDTEEAISGSNDAVVEAETPQEAPKAEPWSPQLVSVNDFGDDELDPPEWIESGHADIDDAELVDASEVAAEQDTPKDHSAEETLVEEAIFASSAAASVLHSDDNDDASETDDLADFDESVIDEEALRDLVAEIVREELTGELGERITRNVRKLVRREIHRALVTREFE